MMTQRKAWFLYVVVAGTVIYRGLSLSSAEAAPTYNFIANQRPRFQIPHGNLSYYRSPQWEVLYYLKFGVFPFYSSSSPYMNRTQYLDRIRLIKTLMDRKTTLGETGQESNETTEGYSDVTHLPHHPTSLPEPPTLQSINSLEESKLSKNYYYPLAQLKKNSYHQAQGKSKHNDDKRKETEQIGGEPEDDEKLAGNPLDQLNFDYFLAESDPTWVKHRYSKQSGINGGMFSDGIDGVLNGMEPGGMAAEMTIERKVGRKFQTQGWKK